jgi:hypothetical protein
LRLTPTRRRLIALAPRCTPQPHGRDEPLITLRMWKHVLFQGCYQLFWLFFFMYALPNLQWERYWLTDACALLDTGPVGAPQPGYCLARMTAGGGDGGAGFNASAAGTYCALMTGCGWPCGGELRGGAACAAAVAAAGGGAFAPGAVPLKARDALCPGAAAGAACQAYETLRVSEQYWEARHEKQVEDDFKRVDSLLFNSFIFLQARWLEGGGGRRTRLQRGVAASGLCCVGKGCCALHSAPALRRPRDAKPLPIPAPRPTCPPSNPGVQRDQRPPH